ncbi:cupin domain-containing protein [Amycolatopsis anabasis]|uniref:cupin domain-containing protein n=1 Tax=Amycolatopsis anabasis TaxID=1840409 RepID=UPI00131B4F38|nr:cupin domain-containing protein [Amycolatopsis anabasis]
MESTLTAAVHRSASGAAASTTREGDTVTAIIHAPAVPVRMLSAGRMHIPGGRATAPQRHSATESALAVLSGYAAVLSGHDMRPDLPRPGDMIYIPPETPYAVVNLSLNASVLLIVFRTDPKFIADVQRVPELSGAVSSRVGQLRAEHLERLMSRRSGRVRRPR